MIVYRCVSSMERGINNMLCTDEFSVIGERRSSGYYSGTYEWYRGPEHQRIPTQRACDNENPDARLMHASVSCLVCGGGDQAPYASLQVGWVGEVFLRELGSSTSGTRLCSFWHHTLALSVSVSFSYM